MFVIQKEFKNEMANTPKKNASFLRLLLWWRTGKLKLYLKLNRGLLKKSWQFFSLVLLSASTFLVKLSWVKESITIPLNIFILIFIILIEVDKEFITKGITVS